MSEMVERATAAAISVIIDAGGTIDFRVQPAIRAAISALGEPTKEMVDAASDYLHACEDYRWTAVAVWQAMHTEMLK